MRTYAREAVGRAGHVGEDALVRGGQAEGAQTPLTVAAEAAADVEGNDNPVADLHAIDGRSHLDHLAEVLVAEDTPSGEVGPTFVQVEVEAADVGAGDADQDVGRPLDLSARYLLDCDVAWPVVNDCLMGHSVGESGLTARSFADERWSDRAFRQTASSGRLANGIDRATIRPDQGGTWPFSPGTASGAYDHRSAMTCSHPLRALRCRGHAFTASNDRGSRGMQVNAEGEDTESERAEVHFLAALLDELMRKMLSAGVLTQADLNEVEAVAAKRVGGVPRAW